MLTRTLCADPSAFSYPGAEEICDTCEFQRHTVTVVGEYLEEKLYCEKEQA